MIERHPRNKTWLYIAVVLIALYAVIINIQRDDSIKVEAINKIDTPRLESQAIEKPYKVLGEPTVYAKTVLLVDKDSMYPLYGRNANEKVAIASTTKMLTALTVMDFYDLDEEVTVTQKAALIGGSKTGLRTGEKITVHSLLKGLLISSGNDTAYALADHYQKQDDQGWEAFVKKMNEKAEELGLKDYNFTCPAGLDDEAYSTAYNLAILASHVLDDPILSEIVKTQRETIYSSDQRFLHELKNTNRLVLSDGQLYLSQATGLKTGYTLKAGHCLVSSIDHNGRTLIAIVLNTTETGVETSAKESRRLLEWGIRQIDANYSAL